MRYYETKIFLTVFLFSFISPILAQETGTSIYMDFRNQKVADIIYSVAEVCGKSVLIDETVTGTATFRFEDKNFENALARFAKHCQLYTENKDGVYYVSKVHIESRLNGKLAINTENVMVEPFINMLSRYTNKTILFDNLPNATVTIRVQEASLEDVLNLAIVKLPGFGLERIADGYYITKSGGSLNKRNIDIFTMSEVDGKFSVNIQKATFLNVIDTLFKKGGREYALFVKPNIQLENMDYSDKDFDELLNLILYQSNYDCAVNDGIYYIYEVQKKDVIKNFKETKVIQLKNISTESLSALLPNELNATGFIKTDKNSNSIILTGSHTEITAIEDFIRKIDFNDTKLSFKTFYLDNMSAKEAVAAIPKTMLMSDVIMLPSENGFITQVTEESGAVLSNFVSILDSKKHNQIVRLKYIKGDELLKALPPSVGKDSLTETNDPTLMFFTGTEKQFADFSEDLQNIDQPKKQIKYQLLVIQRQKTEGFNWSSSLSMGKDSEDDETDSSWSGLLSNIFNINFDTISLFGIQFAGNLNAELSEGKSRVLADTTLNGISGESLSFSNTNTYRYRDIIVDTSGDLYTSTTREITSGLTLAISGWVSGDGMITVKVDAQVSKQGSTDTSSSTNSAVETASPPSTSEKKVSTNVRTKSGEPVVIGGLFQQEEDITEKRIPFLGRIPLLGNFFKSKSVSSAETEFVIYLVPFVEKNKDAELLEDENLARLIQKYGEKN